VAAAWRRPQKIATKSVTRAPNKKIGSEQAKQKASKKYFKNYLPEKKDFVYLHSVLQEQFRQTIQIFKIRF